MSSTPILHRPSRHSSLPALTRPFERLRLLRARRRSLGWLMQRQDDRMLADIGLDREDLRRLLEGRDVEPGREV